MEIALLQLLNIAFDKYINRHRKLRYMDQMKSDMKRFNNDTNSWQRFSSDTTMRRTMIINGSISSEDAGR